MTDHNEEFYAPEHDEFYETTCHDTVSDGTLSNDELISNISDDSEEVFFDWDVSDDDELVELVGNELITALEKRELKEIESENVNQTVQEGDDGTSKWHTWMQKTAAMTQKEWKRADQSNRSCYTGHSDRSKREKAQAAREKETSDAVSRESCVAAEYLCLSKANEAIG